MSYTRLTWVESETPLSAQNMNNIEDGIEELQAQKVDNVSGKGLSTNDYTTDEKTKLAGIAAGAEVNVQSDWSQSDSTADDFIKNKPGEATTSAAGLMSAADKTKLNGIPSDAKTIGYETLTFSNVYPNTTNYRSVSKTNVTPYAYPIGLVITSVSGTNAQLIDIVGTAIEQTDSYGTKFKVKLLLAPSGSSETVSATITARLFYYD